MGYKAKDIEKKGMFGKADPYVKMTLGKQKAKSSTVKNDHNPEWNFKASFDVNPNVSEDIHIEVFDEDLGKDDSLGYTSLKIDEIAEQNALSNQWIALQNCKSGEVLVSAEFIPLDNIEEGTGHDNVTIIKQDDIELKKDINTKSVEKVIAVKEEISTEISVEKGAQGIIDILEKDSSKK